MSKHNNVFIILNRMMIKWEKESSYYQQYEKIRRTYSGLENSGNPRYQTS